MENNEEDKVNETKSITLKSLEKDVIVRFKQVDNEILEIKKQIETIKKAMKSRRI